MTEKIIRFCSRIETGLLFLFCLFLFFTGCYGLYDSYLVYRQANDDSILKYKPGYEGEAPEKEIRGNMVAWLTLEGTRVDYPLMQGDNNFEYLNRDPYGDYSLSGSIFLDSRNSPDFSDEYSLVYGHHMEQGYMFGSLDLYEDEEFFSEHGSGSLILKGKERRIEIIALLFTEATDKMIFDPEERTREELMEYIRDRAIRFRTVPDTEIAESGIIAFTTCRYPDTLERTVLVGLLRQA